MIETITPSADARRWAIGELDFDKLTEPPDTAAVLRAVTEAGYVLSAESSEAVQVIVNPSVKNPSAEQRGRETRLTQAVSEFANTYFEIPPQQRVEQWKALSDECKEIPSLFRWLDQLASGLTIAEIPTSTRVRTMELIKVSCNAFTEKPPGNIRLRQKYLSAILNDPEDCELVVEEMKSRSPEFVSRIAPWIELIPKLEIPDRNEMTQLCASHKQGLGARKDPSEAVDLAPDWVVLFASIAIFTVAAAMRNAQTGGEPVYAPPVIPRPQYNIPTVPVPPPQVPPNKFNIPAEDFERILGEKHRPIQPTTIHPTEIPKTNK